MRWAELRDIPTLRAKRRTESLGLRAIARLTLAKARVGRALGRPGMLPVDALSVTLPLASKRSSSWLIACLLGPKRRFHSLRKRRLAKVADPVS